LSTNWPQLLRELRKERGISQKKLAIRARMPQRTLCEYENIKTPHQLSVQKIENILDALGYEIDVHMRRKYV
jgi:transcriptional regulator with XRE-family HTH domain